MIEAMVRSTGQPRSQRQNGRGTVLNPSPVVAGANPAAAGIIWLPERRVRRYTLDDVAGDPRQYDPAELTKIGRNVQIGRGAKLGKAIGIGPADPLSIVSSVSWRFFVSGDLEVTLSPDVSAWADQSGNAADAVQATASLQPVYNATGLNGHGIVTFDGTDDFLNFSTLSPPAPGTTPSWYFLVFNVLTAGGVASTIFASNNTNRHRFYFPSGTSAIMNNGTAVNSGARSTATWYRGAVFFNNSTTDYRKVGSANVTGANAGNNAGIANNFTLGANNTSSLSPSNVAVACFGCTNGEPTGTEQTNLDAWVTAYYGAGVEV